MNELKNFFESGISLPVLKEGKYTVVLKDAVYTEHPNNPYIKVSLLDTANNRVITTNKFDRGFRIMIAHLKKQLNLEDTSVQINEFLTKLKEEKIPFNIWVTTYTDPSTMKSNTNINFLEPLQTPTIQITEEEII